MDYIHGNYFRSIQQLVYLTGSTKSFFNEKKYHHQIWLSHLHSRCVVVRGMALLTIYLVFPKFVTKTNLVPTITWHYGSLRAQIGSARLHSCCVLNHKHNLPQSFVLIFFKWPLYTWQWFCLKECQPAKAKQSSNTLCFFPLS